MKIGWEEKPKVEPEIRPGQVEIQWKCRERHPNCLARHWQKYEFAPASEAAERVRRYNEYTTLLRYRVKPS